jgi:hypothetical protein
VAILKKCANLSSPYSRCLPAGILAGIFIYSFKMIQAPQEIVFLPWDGDPPRRIHTDGRSLPKEPEPSWMGYSMGKWERDALTVETTGFNDKSWLDGSGHPRSQSMHITERYRRRDFGHIHA